MEGRRRAIDAVYLYKNGNRSYVLYVIQECFTEMTHSQHDISKLLYTVNPHTIKLG